MKVVTSKLKRRIIITENKFREIQNYDSDNKYPQNVLMIIGDSGTATSIADIYYRFINGKGFTQNGDKEINRIGLTLNKLLRLTARDYSRLFGFSFHVNYDANFKIASIHHIPFEHCRLGLPDDSGYISKIAVYDNWDRSDRKRIMSADIDYINIFNPDPVIIEEQVRRAGSFRKYKGQVFWYSFEGDYVYPKSPFDPILEDVETDGRIKNYKYKSILTGFSAHHIFVHKGSFETDAARQAFVDGLNEFQGDENAGNIFLAEVDSDEEVPEIIDFKLVPYDDIFKYTEGSIQNNIRRSARVPPVLMGDLIAGRLGTAEEILDANILYNAFTEDDRSIFQTEFTKVMKHFKTPVKSALKIDPLMIMTEEQVAKRKQTTPVEDGNKTRDDNGSAKD